MRGAREVCSLRSGAAAVASCCQACTRICSVCVHDWRRLIIAGGCRATKELAEGGIASGKHEFCKVALLHCANSGNVFAFHAVSFPSIDNARTQRAAVLADKKMGLLQLTLRLAVFLYIALYVMIWKKG